MYKYSNSEVKFENSCMTIIGDYPVPNYLDIENINLDKVDNNHIYGFANRSPNKLEYKKQVEKYVSTRFYKMFDYIENIRSKVVLDVSKIYKGVFKINGLVYQTNSVGDDDEHIFEILIGENKEVFAKVEYDDYLYVMCLDDDNVIPMLDIINKRLSTHEQLCLSEENTFYCPDEENDDGENDDGENDKKDKTKSEIKFLKLLKKYNYNEGTDIQFKDYILMLCYLFSSSYAFKLVYYL